LASCGSYDLLVSLFLKKTGHFIPLHLKASRRGDASRQQILDFHRQFSRLNAHCVVDCRRDRRSYAGQTNLTDASCPDSINLFVRGA